MIIRPRAKQTQKLVAGERANDVDDFIYQYS